MLNRSPSGGDGESRGVKQGTTAFHVKSNKNILKLFKKILTINTVTIQPFPQLQCVPGGLASLSVFSPENNIILS